MFPREPISPTALLTLDEAAAILGIHRTGVYAARQCKAAAGEHGPPELRSAALQLGFGDVRG